MIGAGADEAKPVSMLTRASAFESSPGHKLPDLHGRDFYCIPYFVYILYSNKFDKFYIGQTNNIENRLFRHNAGFESATKPYIPWAMVWHTKKESRTESMLPEKKLKIFPNNGFYSLLKNINEWCGAHRSVSTARILYILHREEDVTEYVAMRNQQGKKGC